MHPNASRQLRVAYAAATKEWHPPRLIKHARGIAGSRDEPSRVAGSREWGTLSQVSITVSATNFGPIIDGEVDISPFTVFIGPNNTGKSFISTFIYAAELNARRAGPSGALRTPPRAIAQHPRLVSQIREALKRQFRRPQLDASYLFSTMPRTGQTALMDLIKSDLTWYARSLQLELERCLGGKINELASVTRPADSPMELSVSDPGLHWHVSLSYTGDSVDTRVRAPVAKNVMQWMDNAIVNALTRYLPFQESKGRLEIALPVGTRHGRDLVDQVASVLVPDILDLTYNYLFQNFPANRHYLPAARSGIMQSHKSLAAFLVRSAPLVGLQQMEVPQLSGIVTDFISQLLSLDTRRRRQQQPSLAAVADELETQVLHGKIEMRAVPSGYPEIFYRVGKLEAPLVRLSSMISELAPVVLYIRYVLNPGDHLIIEEPEAHLHPESQRQFANALAHLLALGVTITLTTHSDYLLTEINNLIRERTVAEATGARPAPEFIPSSQVAAYLFGRSRDARGTTIQKLAVTKSEGISDEEFGRVTEAIYHEAADLQYKIIQARG
jgi:predicted ATPase